MPNTRNSKSHAKQITCLTLISIGMIVLAGHPASRSSLREASNQPLFPANTPPTVNITGPADGTVFTAPASITINATASDTDGTISKVEFFRGTTLVGTDTSAPYSTTMSNVAAGTYSLTAKATDNLGAATTSSAVSVIVNAPPTVSITSPANNLNLPPLSNITISANASDGDGTITKVDFFQGTTLLGTATTIPYTFTWNSVPAGNYSLTAKATDNRGAVTTSSAISINVDLLPTVSITSPASGAAFVAPATIVINANAADSDGTITKVEFLQGSTVLGTDTTFPYSFTWTNVAVGNYSLKARATDDLLGVTTSITVNISVSNTLPPTVSITSPASGTSFTLPASITITADAADSDGTVSKVDFYAGQTLIGTSTTIPYSITWSLAGACSYFLTAKATDNLGATATSNPVLVIVTDGTIGESTPPNFKIAFIGDQGLNTNSTAVLNLIKNEGAQAVLHSGDFDYASNPAGWDAQINSVLGANFPYFASIGNHDASTGLFRSPGGYQQLMMVRMNRLGISWCGDLGVQASFHYKGIFFLLTSPGITGFDPGNNDLYIRDQLAADHSVWSIASWHKCQNLMQVGGKSNETGWGVYEQARIGGAILATAHEHSYERTHLLSSTINQIVASTSNILNLTKGNSFVFVSGLGGESIRDQQIGGPWWAAMYTQPCLVGDPVCTPNARYGALFGVFNVDGDQNKAFFYFKDVNGTVIDSFTVISDVDMPSISSLSPASATAGGAAFTLTVSGTNFINESVVRINGSNRPTTFVSGTQLTAQLTAVDILSGGTFPVTVFNAATGGGTSNSVNLTINNPVPSIDTLSPADAAVGGGDLTLKVSGANFVGNSIVRFNGMDRLTSFVSSTQLTALIPASDIAQTGTFPVMAFNPALGGGSSSAVDFTVTNPAPAVNNLSPSSTLAGGAALTLTVNGTGFVSSSVVQWNGQGRTTSFVNSTQLTAQITPADISNPGTANVAVVNPAPGGGPSNQVTFSINPGGYEADVAPRPNGSNNGTVSIADWVQVGRFVAGLDIPNPGSEFQRADCATRASLGNGAISISDWVQAGRYAAGLDPVVAAGGPTGPTSAPFGFYAAAQGAAARASSVTAATIVRVVGGTLQAGQSGTVRIELDAQGNENALGFSVTFNPAQLTFVSATKGSDSTDATLNVNTFQLSSGRVGIGLGLPAGSSFSAGTRQIVVLNFSVPTNASGSTVTGFGDQPIGREVVDVVANPLAATFTSGTVNINPSPARLQFSASNFTVSEGAGSAQITGNRSGDTSGASTVDYLINDSSAYVPCNNVSGLVAQNCDYTITAGTLRFAAGETTKSFTVPIIDDAYVEGNETLNLRLANATGASLGTPNTAVLTIVDNDTVAPSSNPIDQAQVFVRQHYLDFLNREPDPGGLGYWTDQIAQCSSDAACISSHRIGVSAAFFIELEFQQTGSVVYRLYKAAYGQRPTYSQFIPDRSQLIGEPQLQQSTSDFANSFVQRPEFKQAYPDSMSPEAFVNKLFDTAGLSGSTERQQQTQALATNSKTRARVLLDVVSMKEFTDREYNPAFVLMQYFGYLRRDPDDGGYAFWLNVLNNQEPNNYRGMVCSFITSAEYQERFSSIVTHTNAECGP